ncbi:MAG: PEP-CTERM sorting domain-containing protein [Planctomycetaceae bacterium]|nr:PEP-CTERM sorting domain-containing protein [Planctomycetaceae bacterium]
MRSKVFYCMVFVMVVSAVGILNAGIISVDFDNTSAAPGLMETTDLAGAPSVRVGNWNPWFKSDGTMGDAGQTIIDDSGAAIAEFTASASLGWASRNNNNVNDTAMFSDIVDVQTSTRLINVSGVPYARYDVYVYMYDDGFDRAGQFTLGSETFYMRGFAPTGEGTGNPAADGSGYVLSTDTTIGLGTDIDQANYVKFSNVSGTTFQMAWTAVNAGDATQRAKVAGFQIVEVPEPTAMILLGLGSLSVLRRKK